VVNVLIQLIFYSESTEESNTSNKITEYTIQGKAPKTQSFPSSSSLTQIT
jgi:hypothetical protein